MRPTLSLKKRTPAPADPATPEVVSTPTPESVAVQPAPVAVAAEPEVPVVRRAKLVKVVNVAPPPKADQASPGADQADKAAQQPAPKPTKVKLAKAKKPATEAVPPPETTDQPVPKTPKAKKPTPEELKAAKDAKTEANRRLNEEQRKRPPNPLLDRSQVQGQAAVGAAGCQRWGSRQAMSACLVVGRRAMTSRRYA